MQDMWAKIRKISDDMCSSRAVEGAEDTHELADIAHRGMTLAQLVREALATNRSNMCYVEAAAWAIVATCKQLDRELPRHVQVAVNLLEHALYNDPGAEKATIAALLGELSRAPGTPDEEAHILRRAEEIISHRK